MTAGSLIYLHGDPSSMNVDYIDIVKDGLNILRTICSDLDFWYYSVISGAQTRRLECGLPSSWRELDWADPLACRPWIAWLH